MAVVIPRARKAQEQTPKIDETRKAPMVDKATIALAREFTKKYPEGHICLDLPELDRVVEELLSSSMKRTLTKEEKEQWRATPPEDQVCGLDFPLLDRPDAVYGEPPPGGVDEDGLPF